MRCCDAVMLSVILLTVSTINQHPSSMLWRCGRAQDRAQYL